MKIGDLFTHSDIETVPCIHCGAPAIAIDGETVHFEVAETGAKTAWDDCYQMVRGRPKRLGTTAEVES